MGEAKRKAQYRRPYIDAALAGAYASAATILRLGHGPRSRLRQLPNRRRRLRSTNGYTAVLERTKAIEITRAACTKKT